MWTSRIAMIVFPVAAVLLLRATKRLQNLPGGSDRPIAERDVINAAALTFASAVFALDYSYPEMGLRRLGGIAYLMLGFSFMRLRRRQDADRGRI